jgi:hypothetical protein
MPGWCGKGEPSVRCSSTALRRGAEIFAEAPSSPANAPVTGVAVGLLRVTFRAGTAAGDYMVTFEVAGGNRLQMFVRVVAPALVVHPDAELGQP